MLLPRGWLFPGRNPVEPLSTRQLNRAVHAAAEAAGIKKRVSPHTLRHSDAPLAAEASGVIGTAMAKTGMAGLGRVTIARRERMVFVEPRGAGMVLITLRSAEEMRPVQFGAVGEIDPGMVLVAETIIQRCTGSFDPATFHDRYQDSLKWEPAGRSAVE